MNVFSRFASVLTVMSVLGSIVPFALVYAESTVAAEPGDLIRGTSFSAVYYMGEDGFRYVFPNEKTYATWYTDAETGELDFSSVKTISDAELAKIQMGGNVTYRPGSKMIKINSDPKTYFVNQGGTLQWVTDEATAVLLYGASWNTAIDDVLDGFFTNYTIGESLTTDIVQDSASGAAFFVSRVWSGTASITDDKSLSNYTWIPIEDMAFGSLMAADATTTITAGQTVKWTNNDSVNHTATADDNAWGTGTMKSGESFVRRFDTPGIYTYHCGYHEEMTGTVVVEAAATM